MRRYRMTDNGEQPVWASKANTERMGRSKARTDFPYGKKVHYGNLTHDAAYDKEWEALERQRADRNVTDQYRG